MNNVVPNSEEGGFTISRFGKYLEIKKYKRFVCHKHTSDGNICFGIYFCWYRHNDDGGRNRGIGNEFLTIQFGLLFWDVFIMIKSKNKPNPYLKITKEVKHG